jgi:predicted cupin superfamily sugar epimerase
MVTPTAPVQLHRIRNDQLYHYYLGDPLEVLLLRSDGTSDRVVVGPNLRGGEYLQLFIPGIPGDTFHTARVMGPMVPWREHRVAGRRARRRRDRQTQGTGGEISVDCP